ncbi:MAG: hypothetical protein AB1758_24055, partial [Candidatus Eremiobacterota bacterium]
TDRVRQQLEREAERATGALENLPVPATPVARPAYELTRRGLEEILELCHWLYDSPEFEPDEVLAGLAEADRKLEQAERLVANLRQDLPLEA